VKYNFDLSQQRLWEEARNVLVFDYGSSDDLDFIDVQLDKFSDEILVVVTNHEFAP
jgi:hypothetical protein